MAQIFKTLEFNDLNYPNNRIMNEHQTKLWKFCERTGVDWRDGVCSKKKDHPFGAGEEEVFSVENTEQFVDESTNNSYRYREVLCIDLNGMYINVKLLKAIHNSCPKLKCLFINITEFCTRKSWKYLIENIAPQLKHLSLDNSICFLESDRSYQTVNFNELFENCKLLKECKLVLFPNFKPVRFDYETLSFLNNNLKLFFIKYQDIDGYKTLYKKIDLKKLITDNNNEKYIFDAELELKKLNSKICDNEDFTIPGLGKEMALHFIPDNVGEPSELGQFLENIWRSKARPQFLRIETREGIHSVISGLSYLSKFEFLRGLNLSIKNECIKNEESEIIYRSIIDNLINLESLTLEFHGDGRYLLKLWTRAGLKKLTRFRNINLALDTKSFKQLKESYNNLKSLQLVNVEFIEKDSDLDTIINIITNMNNLDELIIEYSNEEQQEDEDGYEIKKELFKFTGGAVIEIINRCWDRLNIVIIIGVEFTVNEYAIIKKLFNRINSTSESKNYKLIDSRITSK